MAIENSELVKHAYISAILRALALFSVPFLAITVYFNAVMAFRPFPLFGLSAVLVIIIGLYGYRHKVRASILALGLSVLALFAAGVNCYVNVSISHAAVSALIGTFAISVLNHRSIKIGSVVVTQVVLFYAYAAAVDYIFALADLRWLLVICVGQFVLLSGMRFLFEQVNVLLTQEQSLRVLSEAAAQEKSRFLANMSHEIRTPVAGVIGLLDMLSSSDLNAAQQKQLMLAQQSAHLLSHILDDILDYSKMDAGKLVMKSNHMLLDELLEQVMAVIRPKLAENGNQLRFTKNWSGELWVQGDSIRLQQVLLNLLSNAHKFTQQGTISLAAQAQVQDASVDIRLCVKDTGVGMDKAAQQHLFKPFYQLDHPSTKKVQGTGLGLVITQQIVALMGGTLSVESELGHGSCFCVQLRLALGAPPAAPLYPPLQDPLLAGMTVLVVEDNDINQMILQDMLQHMGVTCHVAANGIEAVALLSTMAVEDLDVVLMDCQMPEMDGYEATRAIRAGAAGSQWQQIPIIALTANALDDDEQKCKDAGMNRYLTKPVEKYRLAAVLTQAKVSAQENRSA